MKHDTGLLMVLCAKPLQVNCFPLIIEYGGYLAKQIRAGNYRGEFIVEVSLLEPTHALPGHPLIQCEASATRLKGYSWEVGDSRPKPFVYTSPAEIRLLLTRREMWIFISRGVILTLIIHWLGPSFFRVKPDPDRTHTNNME